MMCKRRERSLVELRRTRISQKGRVELFGLARGCTSNGVRHADGGRDDLLINDRRYVGRGSALVYSVDKSFLCVDKRLELAH
jgi:hypothetical protein